MRNASGFFNSTVRPARAGSTFTVQFSSRDDVLTLLVHLGYLAYNEDDKTVRIPNEEIRSEYYKEILRLRFSD